MGWVVDFYGLLFVIVLLFCCLIVRGPQEKYMMSVLSGGKKISVSIAYSEYNLS